MKSKWMGCSPLTRNVDQKMPKSVFSTTNLLGRLFFDLFLCYIVANSTTAFAGMRFHASDFAQELFYEILLIFISEKVNN